MKINKIKFNKESDMIFPVTYYIRQGKYTADAYTESAEAVKEAEEKFGDVLSYEATEYIKKSVSNKYSEYGFVFYTEDGGLFTLMDCTAKTIRDIEVKNEILDLKTEQDGSLLETIDTFEAAEYSQRGKVIVKDGKIVCCCVENYLPDEDFTEIAVECAKEYRNKGYAKECVYSLTKELLECGERVRYMCHTDNEASIKCAKSVGFYEIGQDYYFIMEKEEN